MNSQPPPPSLVPKAKSPIPLWLGLVLLTLIFLSALLFVILPLVNAPKIVATETHAVGVPNCGLFGDRSTTWTFTAKLVNTGGPGYAFVNFEVNSSIVTSNIYYVGRESSLRIFATVTLNTCHIASSFNIVIASQQAA